MDGEGWVKAKSLALGDKVRLYSGENKAITSTKKEELENKNKVYNFEVEDFHTYFVSEENILVHNTCSNLGSSGKGVSNPSKLSEVSDIANSYKLDANQYENHIVDRHGPNSTFSNKSKFNSNFDIKKGIDETLTSPNSIIKPNTNGRGGYIFESSYDNPIGINGKGKELNTLKVAIDKNGNVITAFPKK